MVTDIVLRAALLAGLVLHKAVWELMKRGRPTSHRRASPAGPVLRLIKLTKIGVLGFLVIQTLFLSVLPISNEPRDIQAVGLLLFAIGLSVALAGRIALGKNWSDIENPTLETNHKVVSAGIYRFIRHPIYVGDVLLITGLELSLNSWLVVGAVPLLAYVVYRTAIEEQQLRQNLPGYAAYQMRTKKFVPFVI